MSASLGLQSQISHEHMQYCLASPGHGKWRNRKPVQQSIPKFVMGYIYIYMVAGKALGDNNLEKQREHRNRPENCTMFVCFKTRGPKYGVLKQAAWPPRPCDVHIVGARWMSWGSDHVKYTVLSTFHLTFVTQLSSVTLRQGFFWKPLKYGVLKPQALVVMMCLVFNRACPKVLTKVTN